MPARSNKKGKPTPSLLSFLGELLSVPVNFIGGLAVGLIAPVVAVAGIVGGVYLFTKKVPFFSQVTVDEASGERGLTLSLMAPSEARSAFESRLAELKAAWTKVMKDLAAITRQANEEANPTETSATES